jgi:probable blue pigment (indigoidine) exporter
MSVIRPCRGRGFGFRPRPWRMLAVVTGWGACFVAIEFGLAFAPPLWFAALRAILAGVALLGVGLMRGRPMPASRSWPTIGLLGAVNVTFAFAAMFISTGGVATGIAAMLANAQPLLIILPAWVFYQERPDLRTIAGLLIGFTGLFAVALPGGLGEGAALALAAAVFTTAGTLIARRLTDVDVVMVSAWQFVIGGLLLAAWAGIAEGAPQITWGLGFLAALAFLSLIGTAATYLLWFTEVQRAELTEVAAWTMLTPVIGAAFGWILLGERLTPVQLAGFALVAVGMALILLWRKSGHRGPDELGVRGPVTGKRAGNRPPRRPPARGAALWGAG